MSPTIFVTGVSGYIGGHIVAVMVKQHPEWQIVTLVRTEEQANIVKKTWPSVQTVIGDLDSHDVLVEQGAKADVVLQTASADHIPGGQSIIEGMGKGKIGHYVHTSGTGMLHDISNGYGNPSSKIYHDTTDVKEITSLDLSHVHRDVDASIIAAGLEHGVPTAIISPVTIHGIGAGPMKTRSLQIPFLTEAILKRGKAFTVGAGKNYWDNVHINDVATAYILLTEEALKQNGGAAAWGPEGYYFAEATEHTWADVTTAIARHANARGALPISEVDHLEPAQAAEFHPWAPLLWGGNCRSRADRFRALGWIASGPSIYESIPAMVDVEIATLGTQSAATTFDKK